MANPGDRIRALEAENAALHREIVELRNKMDDERRRRESTYRGHESQNMMGNFVSIGGNRELVDDILKQADREKETLLYKIQDLERRLAEERRQRGPSDSGVTERLRTVQRELDVARKEKTELEDKLHQETRKRVELQQKLDITPQPHDKIRTLETEIEYLNQDIWKLKAQVDDEKKQKEEWKNRYQQYSRAHQAAEDSKMKISLLNQDKITLTEDLRRERDSFSRRIKQLEDESKEKSLVVENARVLRSKNDELQKRCQQETKEKENLQKTLDEKQNEMLALEEHIKKIQKELTEFNLSKGNKQSDLESENSKLKAECSRLKKQLELEEKRIKEQYNIMSSQACSIKGLEGKKNETKEKLDVALHEKKEIETMLHNALVEKKEIERKFSEQQQEFTKQLNRIQRGQPQLELRPLANVVRLENEVKRLQTEVQKLEENTEVLRKQCDRYQDQLHEKSFKSQHPVEVEVSSGSIEQIKQDYTDLVERYKIVAQKCEELRVEAKENKENYEEAYSRMMIQKDSFDEARKKLEEEKEQLLFHNHKLSTKLEEAKCRNTSEPNIDEPVKQFGVSFDLGNSAPKSILKKGHNSDSFVGGSTISPEDLQKLEEQIKKFTVKVEQIEEDNIRREKLTKKHIL